MFWWYFERIAKYIILALVATPFVAAFAYLLDTAEGSNNADRARVERRITRIKQAPIKQAPIRYAEPIAAPEVRAPVAPSNPWEDWKRYCKLELERNIRAGRAA